MAFSGANSTSLVTASNCEIAPEQILPLSMLWTRPILVREQIEVLRKAVGDQCFTVLKLIHDLKGPDISGTLAETHRTSPGS